MTQLNESMEFNSPQPFFGVTTNQLSYLIEVLSGLLGMHQMV